MPERPSHGDSLLFDLWVAPFVRAPAPVAENLFLPVALAVRWRALLVFFAALLRVVPDFAVVRDAAAFLPPFADAVPCTDLPLPDPLFFPPPVSLFTVAQARRSASSFETPRLS